MSRATKNKLRIATEECDCADGCDSCICQQTAHLCDEDCRCKADKCENRLSQPLPIRIFQTKSTGWGVKATTAIPAGKFVIEYVGDVVPEDTYKDRYTKKYKNQECAYALYMDKGGFLTIFYVHLFPQFIYFLSFTGYVIDAHVCGNLSRFVNHGCSPNCEIRKLYIKGLPIMAIYTMVDVPAGAELTFKYDFRNYGEPIDCKCESEHCTGTIGSKQVDCCKFVSSFHLYLI